MLHVYLAMIESPADRAKFEQLYERYYKLMIDVALQIVHSGEDAEDAVQQSYLKLIPNLGKITDVSSRQTINYLVIMVRRVCFDLYNARKKVIQISYEDLGENVLGTTDDTLVDEMHFSELLQRIRALPDIYSDPLYLMYCEDFTPKEIAETLGLSVKAAQKRIERARQQLKVVLLEERIYEV